MHSQKMKPQPLNIILPDIIHDEKNSKQYKLGALLGKGGFAEVYLATELTSKQNFACKVTPKHRLTNKKMFEKFQQELRIHKNLNFVHICQFIAVCKDNNNFYFIMELCEQLTISGLYKQKQGLSEAEIQKITYDLLLTLNYLQQHNIVHRDLKPSNIFIKKIDEKLQIKLGDFGLSAILLDNQPRFTLCGTPNFISPELLASNITQKLAQKLQKDENIDEQTKLICQKLPQEFKQGYGFPTDIWSLGCLIFQLAYCKTPFEALNVQQSYRNILIGEFAFPKTEKQFSQQFYQFVSSCLVQNQKQRWTVKQLLESAWICNGENVQLKYLPVQVLEKGYQYDKYCLNYNMSIQDKCKHQLSNIQSIQLFLKSQFGNYLIDKQLFKVDSSLLYFPCQFNSHVQPQISDKLTEYNFVGHYYNYIKEQFNCVHEIYYIQEQYDYSDKFGMGFLFSHGCYSFLYNDETQLISSPNSVFCDYIDKIDNIKRFQFSDGETVVGNKKWSIFKQMQKKSQTIKSKECIDLLLQQNEFSLLYTNQDISSFNIQFSDNISKQLCQLYRKRMIQEQITIDYQKFEYQYLHQLQLYGQTPLPYIKKQVSKGQNNYCMLFNQQFQIQLNSTSLKLVIRPNYLIILNQSNHVIVFDANIIQSELFKNSELYSKVQTIIQQSSQIYEKFNQ